MSAAKIPLDLIKVASPCLATWESMAGDDRARFCDQCSQHVYNISELTQAAAEDLIMEHEGKMCVRYYQRFDGTIMTSDCPVGWRGLKRRVVIGASVAAAALVGLYTFFAVSVFAVHAGGGVQIRNPIEIIHDIIFPPAIAGGICVPPAPPAAGGGQPPAPQ